MNPKKLLSALASLAILAFVACNSGGTITAPEEQPTAVASAPVVATPPVSQPVAPAPGSTFRVNFYDDATFEVFNDGLVTAGLNAFITSFDDQVTPLSSKSQDVAAGKSWNYSFSARCVQLDVDQPGVKLIGAAFYDKQGKVFNPTKNPEKVSECRCTPTWVRAEEPEVIYGDWTGPEQCGTQTRSVTYRYTETQTCTNAKRTVDVVQESETRDTSDKLGVVGKSIEKVVTEHPGTPAVYSYVQYWRMNQGNDNARGNACVNRGGVWLNTFDICDTCGDGIQEDVCKFTFSQSPAGAPGADMTLYNPPGTLQTLVTPATPSKYSVTVTLNWNIAAGAAQTKTFQIVYNGSFVKKQITVSVGCGEAKSGQLVWGQGDQFNDSPNYSANDGHVTGTYSAVVQ